MTSIISISKEINPPKARVNGHTSFPDKAEVCSSKNILVPFSFLSANLEKRGEKGLVFHVWRFSKSKVVVVVVVWVFLNSVSVARVRDGADLKS